MSEPNTLKTWDGMPVAPDPPHGATVVIYHQVAGRVEFLILHRVHNGPDFAGDWAWTPPSGARYPGESIDACARRELAEETGLVLDLIRIDQDNGDWIVYAAKFEDDTKIRLSGEHDRYKWADYEEALRMCKPAIVSKAIAQTAQALGLSAH